jgi:hypothetical protein
VAVPEQLSAPDWVERVRPVRGADLLGLRLPVATIGNDLLDGVTTATPGVRYLAFRAWIAGRYAETRQPDDSEEFHRYAQSVESAIALGNVLVDRSATHVVGSTKAAELVDAGEDPITLGELVGRLATDAYAGPSDQLFATETTDSGVPALIDQRGVPLAMAVGRSLESCELGKLLAAGTPLASATRRMLAEFGELASIRRLPTAERDLLAELLVPEKPKATELARVSTYAILLGLAERHGKLPDEKDLFRAAIARDAQVPVECHPELDGWLRYSVRDMIAATHEAVLGAVVDATERLSDEAGRAVHSRDVIASLVGRAGEIDDALRRLGIAAAGESLSGASMRTIRDRILENTSRDIRFDGDLARWESGLDEVKVWEEALGSDAGALALLPVAYVLATRRVEPGLERGNVSSSLSMNGRRRIGLVDVIAPAVRAFVEESWSLTDAMADLVQRTVDQHVEIAWERMAADPLRNVAVIVVDAGTWSTTGTPFYPWRTNSRIGLAVGWLVQLGLVTDQGLTPEGEVCLERALDALRARRAE